MRDVSHPNQFDFQPFVTYGIRVDEMAGVAVAEVATVEATAVGDPLAARASQLDAAKIILNKIYKFFAFV